MTENEIQEMADLEKFRDLLMNKFIELCNYNDYGKINLLLIGDTVDRIFDKCIDDIKTAKGYRKLAGSGQMKCPRCKTLSSELTQKWIGICPNCGADMRKEQNNG